MSPYLRGAVGGLVGTAAMTMSMYVLYRLLPEEEQQSHLPPRPIILGTGRKLGLTQKLDETGEWTAMGAVHFAYGGLTGALLPFFPSLDLHKTHHMVESLARGAVFGMVVWAGSYFGWLPATGLFKTWREETPKRMALMAFSTMVWGWVTEMVAAEIEKRDEQKEARSFQPA
jgi:hypothetical protein